MAQSHVVPDGVTIGSVVLLWSLAIVVLLWYLTVLCLPLWRCCACVSCPAWARRRPFSAYYYYK